MNEMMSEDDTRIWIKQMRGLRVSKHISLLLRHGPLYITYERLRLVSPYMIYLLAVSKFYNCLPKQP